MSGKIVKFPRFADRVAESSLKALRDYYSHLPRSLYLEVIKEARAVFEKFPLDVNFTLSFDSGGLSQEAILKITTQIRGQFDELFSSVVLEMRDELARTRIDLLLERRGEE